MILTIDTDEAANIGITPVEYAYLQCKKYNLANDLDVETLIELGLMNTDGDLTSHCEQVMFPKADDATMLFDHISQGKTTDSVIKSLDISIGGFYKWIEKDAKRGELLARARTRGGRSLAEQPLEIADA